MSADFIIATQTIPADPGRRMVTIGYHGLFSVNVVGTDIWEVRLTINGSGVKTRRPGPNETQVYVEFTHLYACAPNAVDTIAIQLHIDQGAGAGTSIATFGDPAFNLLQISAAGMGT